jgi:hypothetical protein
LKACADERQAALKSVKHVLSLKPKVACIRSAEILEIKKTKAPQSFWPCGAFEVSRHTQACGAKT